MSFRSIGVAVAEEQQRTEKLLALRLKQNELLLQGIDELLEQLGTLSGYISEMALSTGKIKHRLTIEFAEESKFVQGIIDDEHAVPETTHRKIMAPAWELLPEEGTNEDSRSV